MSIFMNCTQHDKASNAVVAIGRSLFVTLGLVPPPNNPAGEDWQEILAMLHKLLAAAQQLP